MREIPASCAAARNESKRRTALPMDRPVLSTNATLSPKVALRTSADAADTPEWPEGYSGKGGVGISGSHEGSMTRRMYVRGRISDCPYL